MAMPVPAIRPAPAEAPRLSVEEIADRTDFLRLEEEWDALAAPRGEPFYRHGFLRLWLENFAPRARLHILAARDGSGALAAVLPLIRPDRVAGFPAMLVSASNDHSPRFDLIAADEGSAARAFLGHLASDPSWEVIRLREVPSGGGARMLLEAAREAGFPIGEAAAAGSPFLRLPGTPGELEGRLPARLRADMARRRKKLAEKGKLEVQRIAGGLEVPAFLEEGFALEAAGPKGRAGTAIVQDGRARGFYSELARNEAYAGRLALFFLRVGGRAAAFHYGLADGGRYFLLKPAFDERFHECCPGQLLVEDVIHDCLGRGIGELDLLGPDMPWKREWTDDLRPNSWLYLFRDSRRGRALRGLRFGWGRKARNEIRRWLR